MKLTLNLRSPTSDKEAGERVKQAAKAKKAATESLEDAWIRIFGMNLSQLDRQRLTEVKNALESGAIGRRPSDASKRFSKAEALRLFSELNEMQKEQKLHDMVEHMPHNYRLITNKSQLADLLSDLAHEPIIAVDTETTGVDVYSDVIVGISLTLPKRDLHVYIPVAHDTGEQMERDYVLERLRPVLTDENVKKVLHNSKFDIHMFIRHGIRMRGLAWDTMVGQHLLNENEESFALKNLTTKYLNEPSDTFSTLFGKAQFNTIPLDIALAYAAKDTDVTWRLYQFQRKHFGKLPKLLELYETVENPLLDVVVDMEQTGFIIDTEYAAKIGERLRTEIAEAEEWLKRAFGDINFASPAQLSKKLFDELCLDKYLPPKMSKSTDVKTLKLLKDKHEGIPLLLQYREKTKLLGTYIDALPNLIKSDGRVHGSFNQAATVTGRFSSNNPNLQNQPGYVRPLFVPPPGYVLLSGDYSQQEPRLLAHFTGEEVLVESYREGKDLYSYAAAELFGLPIEECGDGSKYRKMMKVGILAVMYSTGTKTLAGQLSISEKDAEDFIAAFFKKYPKVEAWIKHNIATAKKYGYVEMIEGRKRRLPGIKSKDRWERLRAERQTTNARIQGSAAIQTKIAMLKVDELCKRKGWHLALCVHDELAVYAPETITRNDVKEFEQTMLNAYPLSVPAKSDIEISRRWGEGKSVREWFDA